nr:hypothetical protein [Pseudopedobacter sp.]
MNFKLKLITFITTIYLTTIEIKGTTVSDFKGNYKVYRTMLIQPVPVKPKKNTLKKRYNKPAYHYSHKKGMLLFDPYIEKPILQKVWFDSSVYYPFSDTSSQDRFWIKAVGDYDYKAIVFFKIVQSNGNCIYCDSFPLLDLLSIYIDGGGHYATKTRKEEVIRQYVEEFFYEGNLDQTVDDLAVPVIQENFLNDNFITFKSEAPTRSFVYSKIKNGQSLIAYHRTKGMALKFYEFK